MSTARTHFVRWLASIPIISAVLGCSGENNAKEPAPNYAGSFSIKQIASSREKEGERLTWLATANRGENSAKFRIEFVLKSPKSSGDFISTHGALIREDSDCNWFLEELRQLLAAKNSNKKVPPETRLEFDAVILGQNQSRLLDSRSDDGFVTAGGFTSKPCGHWITSKVFVADGQGEFGEFFLNLNPFAGLGEFSIKDEDYGDVVIQELSKILLPPAKP
jgi:hypothetical protein